MGIYFDKAPPEVKKLAEKAMVFYEAHLIGSAVTAENPVKRESIACEVDDARDAFAFIATLLPTFRMEIPATAILSRPKHTAESTFQKIADWIAQEPNQAIALKVQEAVKAGKKILGNPNTMRYLSSVTNERRNQIAAKLEAFADELPHDGADAVGRFRELLDARGAGRGSKIE